MTASTDTLQAEEPRQRIAALPFPRRTGDTIWEHCNDRRDRLYEAIVEESASAGFDVLVERSQNFEFPAWVRMRAWLPHETTQERDEFSQRVELVVTIVPKPRHRFPFEYRIEWSRGKRKRSRSSLINVNGAYIAQWVRHLLAGARRPSFAANSLRIFGYQLWRPVNKLEEFGHGIASTLFGILAFIGVAVALSGAEEQSTGRIIIGALLALIFGALYLAGRWQSVRLYSTTSKPGEEPRRLSLLDSWQTMVTDLGDAEDEVRARITEELERTERDDARCRSERIAYVGPDGQVERDQIVVSLGRGIAFCHVYSYDRNLFVGWDAHVNFGEWAESALGSGYNKRLHRYVDLRTVVPGYHTITEYDLIDVNYLAEWVHNVVTRVLKRIMEERQIDQQIDFTIQRGERRSLIGDQRGTDQGGRRPARWSRVE